MIQGVTTGGYALPQAYAAVCQQNNVTATSVLVNAGPCNLKWNVIFIASIGLPEKARPYSKNTNKSQNEIRIVQRFVIINDDLTLPHLCNNSCYSRTTSQAQLNSFRECTERECL
jgi:hypothetical protein